MERRKLKAAMVAKGFRYRALSDRLKVVGFDVSEQAISRMVTGRIEPGSALRQAIADVLGEPVRTLWCSEGGEREQS